MAVSVTVTRTATEPRLAFDVTVDDGAGTSHHQVTLEEAYLRRLARPGESPEDFVERCFCFLLEREPKEAILDRFDVAVIGRYFSNFETAISQGT
jgi:hypothetical protein